MCDILNVSSGSAPGRAVGRKQLGSAPVGGALQDGKEPMQPITRPVYHRQSQDRCRQNRIVLYSPFDQNLVVFVIKPFENTLQRLDRGCRIDVKILSNVGCFSQGQFLKGPWLRSMQNARSAINILAAEYNHAARETSKDIHQLDRLRFGTQDHVDDDIRSELPEVFQVVG
jgi:hypothetical protein